MIYFNDNIEDIFIFEPGTEQRIDELKDKISYYIDNILQIQNKKNTLLDNNYDEQCYEPISFDTQKAFVLAAILNSPKSDE